MMAQDGIDKDSWLTVVNQIHEGTALDVLGGSVVDVGEDHIEIHMPITDAVRQPFGLLHGGVSMLLAETAASSHATWGVDLTEVQPVGLEINGSHLRTIKEGEVKAVARVVNRSRRFIVHEVEISRLDSDELLAIARVTNYYRKVRD